MCIPLLYSRGTWSDGLPRRCDAILEVLRSQGLKGGIQEYRYERAGAERSGRNVYAVLQGPRADATEAMVLIGAWKNMDNVINYSGLALVLTLARYFKRESAVHAQSSAAL